MTFKKISILSLLMLGLSFHSAKGQQRYSLQIDKSKIDIDGAELEGYQTQFTQSYALVKKEWWRYIKSKAVIFNKITHYELKIPPRGEATTPVYLVSRLIEPEDNGSTKLEVGLKEENLSNAEELLGDLRDLLLDFKVTFYTAPLQDEIRDNEKESIRLSTKINRYQNSPRLPRGLTEDQADSLAQEYSKQLIIINSRLDSLRNKLLEIR